MTSRVKPVWYEYRTELLPIPATAGTNGSETRTSAIAPMTTLTRVR